MAEGYFERRLQKLDNTFFNFTAAEDQRQTKVRAHSRSGCMLLPRWEDALTTSSASYHGDRQPVDAPQESQTDSNMTTLRAAPPRSSAVCGAALDETPAETATQADPGGSCTTGVNKGEEVSSGAVITTLIVRGLPKGITQSELANNVDESGFAGAYDFLYMPTDRKSGKGQGFAFLNFQDQGLANFFKSRWSAFEVSENCIQGRDANIAKWCSAKRRGNPAICPITKNCFDYTTQPLSRPRAKRNSSKRRSVFARTCPRRGTPLQKTQPPTMPRRQPVPLDKASNAVDPPTGPHRQQIAQHMVPQKVRPSTSHWRQQAPDASGSQKAETLIRPRPQPVRSRPNLQATGCGEADPSRDSPAAPFSAADTGCHAHLALNFGRRPEVQPPTENAGQHLRAALARKGNEVLVSVHGQASPRLL